MNKYEKKAKDQLVKLYDHVQGPMPRTRWGEKDHFGLWDFTCFSNEGGALVQVGVHYLTQAGKRLKADAMINFKCPPNIRKEYWRWDHKKKEFNVILLEVK